MERETLEQGLRVLGISQSDLARAAGLSEAAISRQLNGGLRLSEHVAYTAEELLMQRGAQVAGRLPEWAEQRTLVAQERQRYSV
jgi:transcriptional regulator with XRE-family HTH domain